MNSQPRAAASLAAVENGGAGGRRLTTEIARVTILGQLGKVSTFFFVIFASFVVTRAPCIIGCFADCFLTTKSAKDTKQ